MNVIPDFKNSLPHIVILGAGASVASFPNGDNNGKKLPLMNSLVSTLGFTDLLKNDYKDLLDNFEALYDRICNTPTSVSLKEKIENEIHQYFYRMEIPDTPTLYDYLILSLRDKDIIATFNWDPLLLQCARRHRKFHKNLPTILFLHGNVSVGICPNCDRLGYKYHQRCNVCSRTLNLMDLLYPIGRKNYSTNTYIKRYWDYLKNALNYAYYITFYGYGAPESDIDANSLIIDALERNQSRAFSQIDIIDIKPRIELEKTWENIFYSTHYNIYNCFEKNQLWYQPRRSCEAHASAYLMNTPWQDNPFPDFKTISDMHKWVEPLIEKEKLFFKKGIKAIPYQF